MLIAQLVKNHLAQIFDYCENHDPEELDRLMDGSYGKETFKLSFPFCKESATFTDKESIRFYKQKHQVLGKKVRVCSQWTINHKQPFLNYLLDKNIISKEKWEQFDEIVQKKPVEEKVSHSLKPQEKSDSVASEYSAIKSSESLVQNYRTRILEGFDSDLKSEADSMSKYYEVFYSLERSIRDFVDSTMKDKYGTNWWDFRVGERIQESVERKIKDEQETLFTKQSERSIDYATFAELGYIMTYNWDLFSDKFNKGKKVLIRIMQDLNKLRIPIAHCNPFNEKEKDLFYLTVGYWFDILK
jgi:hypothetical protein